MDSTIWAPFECKCYIVTCEGTEEVWDSQVHTQSGHKETEEHLATTRGLDQVYMSPLRPLNRRLNITCHVSIIDKKEDMKWLFLFSI